MKLKTVVPFLLCMLLSLSFTSCSDDEQENMAWEVVANSNPEMIEVVNETTTDFDNPSILWVRAGYQGGDLTLRCVNHPIAFSLIGPNDSYTNPEGQFTLSRVDDNTLLVHFEPDASGRAEVSDMITITNADQKPVVCNTFLNVTRTFGELQPSDE